MVDMTTPTTHVSLRLPRGWIEFDPRVPDLRAEVLRGIRAEIGLVSPEAQEQLNQLLAPLLIAVQRVAETADTILVGLFARVIEISPNEPLVVTANVVLALSPHGADLDMVRASAPGGWTVGPFDPPDGNGVRGVVVSGDMEVTDPGWDTPALARARRYFLPVPGTTRLATLSFLTPNLDLADEFAELFDAVAGSVEFS